MSKHHTPDPDLVWKMIHHTKTCMFVTHDGEGLEGRPFTAFADQDAGKIYFMTGADGTAVKQVEADERVFLTFGDKAKNDFVTIEGDGVVTNDRAKIEELWNPWAEAFFDGPEDPNIRIISVAPDRARYWEAPNAVAATFAMLGGVISGKPPEMGKQRETSM